MEVYLHMSKWEKLLEEIRNLSGNLRFEELQKILEAYGYTMHQPSSGGSHCTFRQEGKNPITIPKYEPIKKVYVKMVKKIVEEAEKNENSAGVHGTSVQNGNRS